jgi:hypothetical protein
LDATLDSDDLIVRTGGDPATGTTSTLALETKPEVLDTDTVQLIREDKAGKLRNLKDVGINAKSSPEQLQENNNGGCSLGPKLGS